MIKKYWDKLRHHLELFFESITIDSVNYVTWATTIVVALLALTTIVFVNYNERQIHKSNKLSKEIEDYLTIDIEKNYKSLIESVDRLLGVLSNQFTYRLTLVFFFVVSYVSGILWLIASIGYYIIQKELGIGDLIIIIAALSVIALTFFILPIILLSFNSNTPLKVDLRNRISLKSFLKYVKSISTIPESEVFKFLLNPSLGINTHNKNKFKVALKQNIPITNFIYTFKFVSPDSKIVVMSMKRKKNDRYIEYHIKSKNRKENIFLGLFKEIKNSNSQYLYVISSNKNELILAYKLKMIIKKEDSIKLEIDSPTRMDMDYQISEVTKSFYNLQYYNSDKHREYKLKEIKE